jgi:hypothetical protein
VAQTKRKRRTKHRGNAAGMVESRGRTGRPPTAAERGRGPSKSEARMNKPPSWSSAANKAAIATILFVAIIILVFKEPTGRAISLGGFMFLLYVPLGFYTDRWIYRRRTAKGQT